ncbi:MAG: acetate--CoA ligase [Phycisphaerales bacterium]|nr:acetate--CoA ligase [Phycisphaerales bacterium]
MSSDNTSQGIESTLHEDRVFQPPKAGEVGAAKWLVSSFDEYKSMYDQSIADPESFWATIAEDLHWFRKWDSVLEWNAPDAKWFVGGKTNVCYNCVDRQVERGHGDDVAIIWEGEPVDDAGSPVDIRRITYKELQTEVSKLANVLKNNGIGKGDVVTIYMGMVPELAIAMLACARIGAPHSVIFGGFSAQAITDRVQDADSKMIITCDGSWRRGKVVPLKDNVDEAINIMKDSGKQPVEHVLCFGRCHNDIKWGELDRCWEEEMGKASADCPCEELDSEDMLFLLYTSGSTGKPKGIVHTTGGYMVYTYLTSRKSFNLIPNDQGGQDQVFWCTADCGWITGHSYIVYGILPNRVPTLMYEGGPDYPTAARFWQMCERHKVTQFYTAPTAIRAFMKWGDEHPASADLSSLQVLGTVGEPINPEAWMWYRNTIGRGVCPIVDTYWQTETGGHVITPLPGATPTTPGSCTHPAFGIDAAVVNTDGEEQPANTGGLMVIRKPWPGMLRGVHGDRQRFIDTYWSTVKINGEPVYTAGDGARRDDNGNFWIMGRIDDVINVSGHRMGTMEVESALVSHESVVEAAVVGMPHEIKGTGIAAFVTPAPGFEASDELIAELRKHVGDEIGAIAKPDMIRFTAALPKTRSGKIMRRLLRSIAAGETEITQDVTTLEDFSVVAKLAEKDEG